MKRILRENIGIGIEIVSEGRELNIRMARLLCSGFAIWFGTCS